MVRMKTLKLRCGDYKDQLVGFKKRQKDNNKIINKLQESISPLTKKVATHEAKVKELEEQCSSQVDLFISEEGEKVRLSKKLGKLQGELSNAEMRVVAKQSTSQEYLNDLGIQYVRGFEHFHAQASTAFKDILFQDLN